jgi:type I restriction-modification system DNA methylase subunit
VAREENYSRYSDDDFKDGSKLGEINFSDGDSLIICAFEVKKELSERAGKKAQYEKGKKILKHSQSDAGIFIFYDPQGNFRFSLIYANYLGTRRDWSAFRRFTYLVSKEYTNKTFLEQIGKGDFSSLQKIKEAFSVEPVTKQFYGELQYWYFWAMEKIKFPDDYKYSDDPEKDKEIRNATNLIRLITRIIFIWFLTEKGLIPSELFSREKLGRIVKDFMKGKKASNFYNAILQNLFFGTLNQKMDERKFIQESGFQTNRKEYGVKNLYRYGDNFLISKDGVFELFKDIPFLNGGLFDCLDKEDESGKVIYVDGFSRNPAKQSIIPDYLFFQQEEERVSLSNYGLGTSRPVRGLIEILNSYNFTIDENTPVDQEIALDPELLGKVFENLLASYNPETATTARKATGSYYTPREIVDYMVEESLFEYLKGRLSEIEEEKIRMLLSYSEEIPEFSEPERQKIILAIDDIKILDPACGSGAFPMGILHKLVYALQKLDPENKYWHELQYQKALKESEEVFKQDDKNQRQERLKEINEAFDEGINYPDYARKLYLIENCIYGVDIQPIAIQISKLRFFISLVLDQKVDMGKENLGIRALPNLETKFVAANTLIGIEMPHYGYYTDKIRELEDEIKALRHRYFQAKTHREKLDYQKKDRKLRELLAEELKSIGISSDPSEKIATFDIYDQNASADWFDPEWMFGIKSPSSLAGEGPGEDGFDIVIANPPYIGEKGHKNIFREIKIGTMAQFYTRKSDLFYFFFHFALNIAKDEGTVALITTNYYLSATQALKLRTDLKRRSSVLRLINFNEMKIFDSALGQHNMITVFRKGRIDDMICRSCITHRSGWVSPTVLQNIITGIDPNTDYWQIPQSCLYEGVNAYIRPSGISENSNNPAQIILQNVKSK